MTQQLQIVKEWMPTPAAEFKAVARPKEYADLITCRSPKFPQFVNRYGRAALEELFGRVILEISEGLGLTISGTMASDAVGLIIDDFPDTKLSDMLMFKRDVLGGKVGGQVDDKLWKWNTRAIVQAWGEYYARREETFCEHRENRIRQDKSEYNAGIAKAYANATPVQQERHREYLKNIEKKQSEIRAKVEHAKDAIPQKMDLYEIAISQGVNLGRLAEVINTRAEARRNGSSEPLALFVAAEMAAVLFEARKDPGYLSELTK